MCAIVFRKDYLKRSALVVFFTLTAMLSNAQIIGGFNSKDPKAWFDKEIYFIAYNNVVAYGYGQPIYNATFVVNGKDTYFVKGVWEYGQSVAIDGTKMKKGSIVELFINGQYVSQWVCEDSTPSIAATSWSLFRDYRILKRVIKLMKKVR